MPKKFLLPALATLAVACASDLYARIYHTEDVAPSLSWDALDTMEYMGPTLIDQGVNFCVYSERAERMELLLFDDPESELPTWQVPLTHNGGPIWNVYVEGIGVGQHYGYIAWGPNWQYDEAWYPGSTQGFQADVDGHGNRFNPNKLLFDPWSKALHRDFDWSGGSPASGPKAWEVSYGSASKSVIVTSDYEWSSHEDEWRAQRSTGTLPGHDWTDLVLYEAHPKGFTRNHSSEVEHPGTFRGFGEMATYLSDLGITAVEIMPIHEKPLDGGYWGYNTLNFFAPEVGYSATYATTGDVFDVIDEFKWMVDQLHQAGVEVIVDVVYNHTGEGGLWRERLYFETYGDAYEVNFDPKEVAGIYSYRGLDNSAWYALTSDGQYYWDNTGVGNETRPNNAPMHQLTLDSLHFMAEELHVDGFRFDLAGILGEQDLDYDTWIDPSQTLVQDIIDDPVLKGLNTRIIAEPWTAAGNGPGIGGFPTSSDDTSYAWAEWNARFRDTWRSFVNNDDWRLNSSEGEDVGGTLTGSADTYSWNGRKPYHSVNFVTVHDGFTMYDLVTYEQKQNGCGLLNPVCCDEPLSVWCDESTGEDDNRSRDWEDEATKRQMMRNLFTAMFVAEGTPMILGGDEWMRTQYGNNNAYTDRADNEWNWYRWSEWQSSYAWSRHRMHDFVRELTRFRKDHTYALNPSEYGGGMPMSWKNASNSDMSSDEWSNDRHVAMHFHDDGNWSDKPELLVLINMERDDVTFSLPGGITWGRIIDTQSWFDTPGTIDESGGWFDDNPTEDPYHSANVSLDSPVAVSGSDYTVRASTIVVLEEQ